MVRLKVHSMQNIKACFYCFNSKMVRLKAYYVTCSFLTLRKFQFQNGAVKSSMTAKKLLQMAKFQFQNGAVKSYALPHWIHLITMFQFQNGAVKSDTLVIIRASYCGFNSKMVRLKAEVRRNLWLLKIRFNSTMVRLKAGYKEMDIDTVSLFQFQNGAVKRYNSDKFRIYTDMFQFQNGAVKRIAVQ